MEKQKKIILGLCGPMASGKTTVTNYCKETYGAVSFRFSDMLRDVLARIDIDSSRENMQALSTFLRGQYGEDLMSNVIAKDVANETAPFIIVEGVRRPTDVTYLRDVEGFHLVAITAEAKTRFDRITARTENPDDQTKTWATFQKEQEQEAEQEIGTIMATAEMTIDNNGTVEELFAQVDMIVDDIRKDVPTA